MRSLPTTRSTKDGRLLRDSDKVVIRASPAWGYARTGFKLLDADGNRLSPRSPVVVISRDDFRALLAVYCPDLSLGAGGADFG